MTNKRYKKYISEIIAILTSLVMVFNVMSVFAASNTVTIKLKVKSGEEISAKFNAASDKARYNKAGKYYKIVVPKGKYKLSSQIRLYSNTTAVFTGAVIVHKNASSTMLRLGRKSADWDNYNKGKGRPGYSGFKNIKIIGGTFDGGGLKSAIMRFGHSKNITISGTTFKNVKNSHFVEFGACSGVKVTKCKFIDFVGDYSQTKNIEALQIDALAGDHFSAYNPNKDETPCKNFTVSSCVFKNLERGLGTHTGVANSYFTNMVFENNTFENITGYAIVTTNYANSRISGNVIKNCGSGIHFRTCEISHTNFYASKYHSNKRAAYYKLNTKINNNKITITKGYKVGYKYVGCGVSLFGEKLAKKTGNTPAGDFRCAGVAVDNNTIVLKATGYGIYTAGAAENSLKNNKVYLKIKKKGQSPNAMGIKLISSPKNTINNNTVTNKTETDYDLGSHGINIYSSGSNTVSSNTVTGLKKDGIHIEKSNSTIVSSNTVTSSSNNGIGLYSSKNTSLTGNTITSSGKYGMYSSYEKSKAIKVDKNNKITKSGKAKRSWS